MLSSAWSGFVLKKKTADALRIRNWSSDVCSSDLRLAPADLLESQGVGLKLALAHLGHGREWRLGIGVRFRFLPRVEIRFLIRLSGRRSRRRRDRGQDGSASGRERVCQYEAVSVVAGSYKEKANQTKLRTRS